MIDSVINFITNYYNSLSLPELISFGLIIGGAFVIILLERIFPYSKGQKFLREGFFNDLALYTIAQSYILGIIIFGGIIYYIDNTTGLSRLGLFANIPIWLQLLFFLITHDIYIYWMHRWQHKNKWLWRIHEAHHSPKKVDWLSGSRSHAFEILINQTIEFAPIVLLGSPPEVIAYKGVISAVWGMYIHSNINVNTGRLQYIINGPEMHRWHHDVGKGRNRNFATKLAIWDWIWGSAYLPRPEKPKEYGLKSYFPDNFIMQFIFAFMDSQARKKK
ncbi:MAG: sterol desaturase family protein [Ignavibacteriales bacterium]|jgi:sterol desaturase/sphingolipid hydroxylase (fatty acid hydroxylase superfamily)|nr:MAG: sterol desaturase family protein [Ignavibacteriales bacterium]